MLINGYLGGYLLSYITVYKVFFICGILNMLPVVAGVMMVDENKKRLHQHKTSEMLKQNMSIICKFIKKSYIFKPLILIILVIIGPGVENPMFYFYTNVMKLDSS